VTLLGSGALDGDHTAPIAPKFRRVNALFNPNKGLCCPSGVKMFMNKFSNVAFSALVMGSVALPTLAQTPSAGNATTAPATHDSGAPASSPSERNAALTDEGNVRASKLVGSAVYNDHDEKIGSVDDIILGKGNNADEVIVSVGGILGAGAKLVSVPYAQLRLGDTKTASSDNKVVLPGATKESLKALPEFHYSARA
jgi:sporulation protein YlmC with PRC-barrel domain